MQLKRKTEAKTPDEVKKEQNSRRGRRSRNKGASFERTVAKKFKEFFGIDLVRTPQSGGFAKNAEKADDFRGDIVSANKDIDINLNIECKNAKTWSLPAWLKQSESDCPKNKKPCVVMHKGGTSNDYIVMKLEDFFDLCNTEKLFTMKSVMKGAKKK